MSSLLSSPDTPFVIQNGQDSYSFIDQLNPSGGNNSKVESTGVITRFSLSQAEQQEGRVRVKLLSVVDLVLLVADSYYNDLKLNPDSLLAYDQINQRIEGLAPLWQNKSTQQKYICEDDIKDIFDYIKEVIGSQASDICRSNFSKVIAAHIHQIPVSQWKQVFGLLWNENEQMTQLFGILMESLEELNFQTEVYVPFEAVLRDKGTLLKIDWLDSVCNQPREQSPEEILTTAVYDRQGQALNTQMDKGRLSALIAELTFVLPQQLASERQFLKQLDLLDFPGARSREKFKESEIATVLPKVLRRGKVAYLFNKYSRSLRIGSVLFCHHNDQKTEPTLGDTINNWIEDNIGRTPQARAELLRNTHNISPLFMVATKFNIDLERSKTDTPAQPEKLDAHWNRFDTVLPEIIKPNTWMENWVPEGAGFASTAFQNVFPLRDFYWSGKNGLFEGYSDGQHSSAEVRKIPPADYPNYWEDLRASFLRNAFVQRHFASPEDAWDSVASLNNDGSKAIIGKLDTISSVLDEARRKSYRETLLHLQKKMLHNLEAYYEPEDSSSKNLQVKKISGDIRRSLIFGIGERPELFGRIIDTLMVPVSELRDIAYDIIICHSETPKDFSAVNFVRGLVGINPKNDKQSNIEALCDFFCCDAKQLDEELQSKGCTLDEVVSSETETLTTVADVVTQHLVNHWVDHLNAQAEKLEEMLPHAHEVVRMLIGLMQKLGLKKVLSEKIHTYCTLFQDNEQPNAIADFASLTFNNFVSSVGRNYMDEAQMGEMQSKAAQCQLSIDTSPNSWNVERKPQPLIQALQAFDAAADIVNQDRINMDVLRQLPLWDNFQRWQNLVTLGLIYASDISNVDPVANAEIKTIIDNCQTLYS